MKKTALVSLGLATALLLGACSPRLKQRTSALPSAQDSVAYAFGVLNSQAFSSAMAGMPGDSLSREQILQGFSDAFLSRPAQVLSLDEARRIYESYINGLRAAEARERSARADSLLRLNAQRPGVQTTASGLQWRVLRAAEGQRPSAQDTVVVNYVGRLADGGKEFDSSYKHGEPATLPLSAVIKGWTEGIGLMSKGAKYEFLIPAPLAYGERGAGGVIPPGAPLFFEVELLDIKPYVEPQAADEVSEAQPQSSSSIKASPRTKAGKRTKRTK